MRPVPKDQDYHKDIGTAHKLTQLYREGKADRWLSWLARKQLEDFALMRVFPVGCSAGPESS